MSFERVIIPVAGDIDELGHVNNAVWVQWIQNIAIAHWQAVAPPAAQAAYVWVVIRHEIDYLGNVGVGDPVTARTWISEPPSGARFNRNLEFADATGKIIVRAKTSWAMLDRARGRLVRVPTDIAAAFLSAD